MYKVSVLKTGVEAFGSTFEEEEQAKTWIESQIQKGSWGKPEQVMVVTEVVRPMELIEEVTGPMGIKAYKVKLPADYEVIIEEILPEPKDITQEVRHILKNTDWLFISDVPLAKEFRVVYKEFRQKLRGLPKRALEVESFETWIRRNYPEHFLEGRSGPKMVEKFNTYL